MHTSIKLFGLAVVLAGAIAGAAAADNETVIYNFAAHAHTFGRPLQDSSGALYATTFDGGKKGIGSVVQLTESRGVWHGATIYDFTISQNGAHPAGGLSEDANGVIYGTTFYGGAANDGAIFSLTFSGGTWNESVLHSFDGSDGDYPKSALTYDATTGDLYGTTSSGGAASCGTAFQLSNSGNTWSFNHLYDFKGGADGCLPDVSLRPGPQPGTYYGATTKGGLGRGTVYQLKEKSGAWSESVLYAFSGGSDGEYPSDLDSTKALNGRIFGVATSGGLYRDGVVYELRHSHGKWIESVVYSFRGGRGDGVLPVGIKYDVQSGNFYGTTEIGGTKNEGTAFVLTPNGKSWDESLLHSFGGTIKDGIEPPVRPIQDATTDALYGITSSGGQSGGGTVWTIPVTQPGRVRSPTN